MAAARRQRRAEGIRPRLETFVREYTEGLRSRDVKRLFADDAARAYQVLARDRPQEPEPAGRFRRALHRAKVVFLGLSYKLSPARRLVFAISLFAAFARVGAGPFVFDIGPNEKVRVDLSPLWFAIAIGGLVYLLAVELVDRVLIRDELEVARSVQRDLIPADAPAIPGWRIAHSYRTANEVGGDFYDFVPLDDDRLAVVVGDAAGHGMAAGLVMAVASATFRAALELAPEPLPVAGLVHRALLRRRAASRSFLTLFYLLLEPSSGRFSWVSAAHPFPLLVRAAPAEGSLPVIEEIGGPALPLGVRSASDPSTGRAEMRPGDRLVLLSDGLVEARDAADAPFGEARLRALVSQPGGAQEIHDRILAALELHAGEQPLADDITLVVLERLPS